MPTDELLLSLLKKAVKKCYEKDSPLIERSMEQASVARIYYYMQNAINTEDEFSELKQYNLDCEYNKNGQHIKTTPRCPKGTRPDIILHKRNCNDANLIVIEFKPRNATYRKKDGQYIDTIKLEDFTSGAIYNYQIGVLVKLHKKEPKYEFFKHGQKIDINLT